MKVARKPLFALTAADLMSAPVVTIPQEMPLAEAARVLEREQISGAPVTDSAGRCVGVLSTTDFARWAQDQALPADNVGAHLTADPVTVLPDMKVRDVARVMLDAHIHRVGVVNEGRRLVGIVSTTDVLAAVAYSEDGATE